MKKLLLILSVLFAFTLKGQNISPQNLIGKKFSGMVGFVCVETSLPRNCSGTTNIVELNFKKDFVTTTEKEIQCSKTRIVKSFNNPWKIKGNQIIIGKMTRYGELLNIPYLQYKNQKLYGTSTGINSSDYEFTLIK